MEKRRVKETKQSKRDFSYYIKWFLFWFVINGILILLFELITIKYNLIQKPLAYYLILGLFLRLVSKFISCAVNKRTFSFRGIFSWTIIYALLLFVIDFLLGQFGNLKNMYLNLTITSIVFTILVIFLRRSNMNFNIGHNRFRRAPSQIFTGIILVIFGILCWRFSTKVFIDWLGWTEGVAWSWLIGLGFIIAGFLTLLAWWRNNVLQHSFGVKFGKW